MKKYDRIRTLPLVEVFNSYIEHNGLSRAYAARCTKIPYTNLAEWSRGLRGISQRNAGKIRNFLNGNFLIDVDMIINYLLIQKEMEKENIDLTEKQNVIY